MTELKRTALYDLHQAAGARMVPFAGYEMPVQYPSGVMKEHAHCRAHAGLFDVSHMAQVILSGRDVAAAVEALMPIDVIGLAEGRQRYGMLTNASGGILDDLMIANRGDHLFAVLNAARAGADLAHLRAELPDYITVTHVTDRALLALQGPQAQAVLSALNPAATDMRFMDVATLDLLGQPCWISRSGYTGEDGYEISVPVAASGDLARALLSDARVEWIGLGARDSLRLEAGLCLYGHDMDETTTPVEAALGWAVSKVRRRDGARAGGFAGADVILTQMETGTDRVRVGLLPEGRAPMREGVLLFDQPDGGSEIGRITSGGFGPSLERPLAMGYVSTGLSAPGTTVYGELRGKRLPLGVATLPFRPAGFKRTK